MNFYSEMDTNIDVIVVTIINNPCEKVLESRRDRLYHIPYILTMRGRICDWDGRKENFGNFIGKSKIIFSNF